MNAPYAHVPDHTTQARLAHIHRCTCGAWIYAATKPTTCTHMQAKTEATA
jgi:hypothetical protein